MLYYSFLFSVTDEHPDSFAEFLEEFQAIMQLCHRPMTLNLYTTVDYKETILREKLQRCYLECSEDCLPLLGEFLQRYFATEALPPVPGTARFISGTTKQNASYYTRRGE